MVGLHVPSLRLRASPGAPGEGPSAASLRLAWAASLLLAFASAASVAYWGLRVLARPVPVPGDAQQIGRLDTDALVAAAPRLFGATAAAQPKARAAGTRFRLWGVIGGGSQAGAALIGVDGKPPRAVAVGGLVEPGVRLDSTAYGQAVLDQDGVRVELKLQPQSGAPSVPGAAAPTAGGQLPGTPAQMGVGPGGATFLPSLSPPPAPRP